MDQFNSDFDQYTTAFRLAQAHCGVDLDSILVDALQQGVTNQFAVMMTAAALPEGQEKTGWKWEQWLNKAGEFYQNMVQLRKLRSEGSGSILLAQKTKASQLSMDPYTMDVDRINHSPSEQVEHMQNCKCFICHKEGCHSSKHKGYLRDRGKPLQQGAWTPWRTTKTRKVEGDFQINNFMKQHWISTEQALNLIGNYYSHMEPATT